MIRQSAIFEVFSDKRSLYTKNLVPGIMVYGERLVRQDGVEYREWNPNRSKLCAAIKKGAKNIFIRKGDIVLYLGAASGTTVSHVSDIIGTEGFVFALDFSPRVVRDLVFVAEDRKNIAPILGDALQTQTFLNRVCLVDVVYQDVAQHGQGDIFLKNCNQFLKKGGYGILAVKARSVDISKKPKQVFKEVRAQLEREMVIVDYRELDPFEKDHCLFICKKK